MRVASNLQVDLDRGVVNISALLDRVRGQSDGTSRLDMAPLNDMAPLSPSPVDSTSQRNAKPSDVTFVRLRHQESANLVVLSDAEKYQYAKAAIDPLLDRLASLSTAKFFSCLASWSELLAKHIEEVESAGSSQEDARDETNEHSSASVRDQKSQQVYGKCDHADMKFDNCDCDSVIETGDILGDLDAMAAVEDEAYPRYLTYIESSQVLMPSLDLSERSQAILETDVGVPPGEIVNPSIDMAPSGQADPGGDDNVGVRVDVSALVAPQASVLVPQAFVQAPQASVLAPQANAIGLITPHESPSDIKTPGADTTMLASHQGNGSGLAGAVSEHSSVASGQVVSAAKSMQSIQVISERNVDVLCLPKPKRRNTTRKSVKQGHIQAKPPRTAVMSWPQNPINLSDML
jgi:hypothetical protein